MIYTAKMARKDAMEKNKQTHRVSNTMLSIKQQAELGNSSIEVTGNFDDAELNFLRDIGYFIICQRKGSNGKLDMYHISW